MPVLASVLIDTFNHGAFIENAIESVLEQSFPSEKFEIIVIDDGSTDDTSARVLKYGARITYVRKANGGQGSALNAGFTLAKGEYILLLDGDDMCRPDRVAKVVAEFEAYPDVALVFNSREIIRNGLSRPEHSPEFHNLELGPDSTEQFISCGFGFSRMSIRRTSLTPVLPVPEDSKIGGDIYLMALLWFGRVSSLPEALTTYRVHENNLFHTSDPAKLAVQAEAVEKNISAVRERIKKAPQFDEACAERVLLPFVVMLKGFELEKKVLEGTASRKDVATLERLTGNLKRESLPLRFKRLLKLPLLLLLPPRIIVQYRQTRLRRFKERERMTSFVRSNVSSQR